MKWWHEREPREQALIGVAGVLLVLLIGWQFLVKPVTEGRAEARLNHTQAARDLDIVQKGLPLLSVGSPDRRTFDRNAVINAARSAGLGISRVQPGQNGAVQVWFEDTDAPRLYTMLNTLTEGYAVSVSRAHFTRRDGGLVSAQITLSPGS